MYSAGTAVASAPAASPSTFPASTADASRIGGGSVSAGSSAAHNYGASDVPRNEDDITQYVLYDGLPQSGPSVRLARERQSQAYLHFTHRIRERVEAAHAIVLSANPLSLSVMASQLRMYRWKVTEAQTLVDVTSLLQDFVIDASKRGYRVRRQPPAPLGQSRYAHGRGKRALQRIAQEERDKLWRGPGVLPGAATNLSPPSSSGMRADLIDTAAVNITSASSGRRTAAATSELVSGETHSAAEREADDVYEEHEEDRLPLPPPDALPRLILVDSFTHEDVTDIARHIRFVDNEHGLEMLLVLLLPEDPEATAVATQGAGCVVIPEHQTTMEDAYKAGYDLVLAHGMDNLLVEFVTSAFVSSVGRWRNDVRSKAAVGNYMSVRTILLGGLDVAMLQQLVWDDKTDDVEVLELLGAQSLSTQGKAKRYSETSRQLLLQQQQQQQQQPGAGGSGTEGDDDADDDSGGDKEMKRVASSMMGNVPRLRNRPTSIAHFGVRLPADAQNAQIPLAGFGRTKDVLGGIMGFRNDEGSDANFRRHQFNAEGADANAGGADERMLRDALETELGRLLAENEGKQATIDTMQKDIESLHRTVEIIKRHLPGSKGSVDSIMGAEMDSVSRNNPERPDSGSMMHLGKQQQIYILKERLEAANDQIVALLKNDHGTESQTNATGRGRNRGGVDRGGRGGNALSRGGRAPGPVPLPTAAARRAASSGIYPRSLASSFCRRRANEAYQAAREAEMMALLDDDAYYVNDTIAELSPVMQTTTAGNGIGGASGAGGALAQRKEREATDQVIHSLNAELKLLRSRLDEAHSAVDNGGDGEGDLQARMTTHLQAAVERLEAERQRIHHLEELRQADQLLLTHAMRLNGHMKRQLSAASRQEESDSDGSAGDNRNEDDITDNVSSKRGNRHAKGPSRSRARRKPVGADGAEEERAATRAKGHAGNAAAPGTDAAVAAPSSKAKKKRGQAEPILLPPAQVEDLIATAVADAVAERNRVFQRQLDALMQTCKAQLTRVVLKLQRPHTLAYVQMLREELEQAKRDQRGAFMRLQFTLSHLLPDQYDAANIPHSEGDNTDEADGNRVIPLRAVKDVELRRTAESIAREHAAYALRVAYMTTELQRVERAHESAAAASALSASFSLLSAPSRDNKGVEGEAELSPSAATSGATAAAAVAASLSSPTSLPATSPEELLQAYQNAAQHVKEAIDNASPLQIYLDAVQAELEAEQRLSKWCDIDCAQLFRSPALSPTAQATLSSPYLSLLPANLPRATPSPSKSAQPPTEESTVPLHLADVDGSIRDMADVYGAVLRSCARASEGWSPGSHNRGDGNSVRSRAAPRRASPARGVKARKTDNTRKANSEKTVASASDVLDAESLGEDCMQSLSVASTEGLSFQEALAQLPVESSEVPQYQGQLERLYASGVPYSAAHRRLYEVLLRAYQQNCINPLHMAMLETTVLTLNETASFASESSAAASPASAPTPVLVAAHAQHREVLALLQIMGPRATPALRNLTKQILRAQPLLEKELDPSYQSSDTAASYTSVALLSAVDAALLGCVVDELRWQQWQHATTAAALTDELPPQAVTSQEMLREALVVSRTAATPALLLSANNLDDAEVPGDVRTEEFYATFCASRARLPHGTGEPTELPGSIDGAYNDSNAANDIFDFNNVPLTPSNSAEAYRQLASLLPGLNAAAAADSEGAGRTVARELAELFSKRPASSNKTGDNAAAAEAAEVAFLTDLYLDANADGAGGERESDESMQAIRRLRMEIEYIEVLKKQRMDELAMRYDWRMRGHPHGNAGRSGPDGRPLPDGQDGANNIAYPPIDPERLNFTVKSGTSAWYGMEASKRVRAILRRRARPDQIIVGGGPEGGGLGVELSRRTAQPAVVPPLLPSISLRTAAAMAAATGSTRKSRQGGNNALEDENGYQVEDEGDDETGRYEHKGSSASLPPLPSSRQQHQAHQNRASAHLGEAPVPPPPRPSGMSRARQRLQQRFGLHPYLSSSIAQQQQQADSDGTLQQPFMYMTPRDAVSLNAFANLASGYDEDYSWIDSAYLSGAVEDLDSRVLAYRAELMRAAGRLSPASTSTYANGAPYCLPLACPLGAAGGGASNASSRSAAGAPSHPLLPQQTSWVYGVPAAMASSLVQQQTTIDPRRPRDTMLFMPPRNRSSIAEVAERAHTTSSQWHLPPRFVGFSPGRAGAGCSYTTPAAMAAQRLQTMLSASMEDPSVCGGARASSLAAMRVQQLLEQQRCQQQQQHDPTPSATSAPSSAETATPP
ncbi:hypothetical protein ABL78_2790 [Leptomonas seymouri]|uniref:Uncharacterized protein n=1 Tax=Leptomonas seymouri TaxID=5684 RepID=A0A0N1I0E2_LEPSE|nr:hypothetical protein ABL78_2790 [Leptomonas seymouri]|eukprot:KPI88103.1 hypothetical protein ABL78_2790 [Leptomonas seymouri]